MKSTENGIGQNAGFLGILEGSRKMNYAEKMEIESRLKTSFAEWMIGHGNILHDRTRSNAYTCVRIVEVLWQIQKWRIFEVDGMVCRIERISE